MYNIQFSPTPTNHKLRSVYLDGQRLAWLTCTDDEAEAITAALNGDTEIETETWQSRSLKGRWIVTAKLTNKQFVFLYARNKGIANHLAAQLTQPQTQQSKV